MEWVFCVFLILCFINAVGLCTLFHWLDYESGLNHFYLSINQSIFNIWPYKCISKLPFLFVMMLWWWIYIAQNGSIIILSVASFYIRLPGSPLTHFCHYSHWKPKREYNIFGEYIIFANRTTGWCKSVKFGRGKQDIAEKMKMNSFIITKSL